MTEDNKLSTTWEEMKVFPIPAAIYLVKNLMQYVIFLYVDAPSYQILKNLNIITTGILYRVFLKKHLTPVQWSALTLLALGCTIAQTTSQSEQVRRPPPVNSSRRHSQTSPANTSPPSGIKTNTLTCTASTQHQHQQAGGELKGEPLTRETASKTDENDSLLPHNASSAPWSSPPSLTALYQLGKLSGWERVGVLYWAGAVGAGDGHSAGGDHGDVVRHGGRVHGADHEEAAAAQRQRAEHLLVRVGHRVQHHHHLRL